MITVPERWSYIECYLTLRCSFGCRWCINASNINLIRKRKELTAREWIIALNNLDTHGLPVTLGGGEPTMHPEFYPVVNGTEQKFDLLTNGSFDVSKFLKNTKPDQFYKSKEKHYKSIRISFHPGYSEQEKILNVAKRLNDAGYSAGIFGTSYPENLRFNNEFTEMASMAGIFFFIRDYLGWYENRLMGDYYYPNALNGHKKKCKCRTSELLVDPTGTIYRCHADLYEEKMAIGNILNMAFDLTDEFMPCDRYGTCNFCDIKRKLGPDLKSSRCSVEIIEA